jgi:hypothetical protein
MNSDGLVKERFSNTGKSMCLYTKENTPICYIDIDRFEKIKSMFAQVKGGYKIKI